jgi:hypothetical protein
MQNNELLVIMPDFYRIVECKSGKWAFSRMSRVYAVTEKGRSADVEDYETLYGITPQLIVNQLYCEYGNRDGYYLLNLRQKQYYYCGLELSDVKMKLRSLGIGQPEPTEESHE